MLWAWPPTKLCPFPSRPAKQQVSSSELCRLRRPQQRGGGGAEAHNPFPKELVLARWPERSGLPVPDAEQNVRGRDRLECPLTPVLTC